MVTEEYPPFSFRDGVTYKGVSIDQIEFIMKRAGIPHSIEMMPWARALALAQTEPQTCVFTTVHNEDRDKHFKWVEPLLEGRTVLMKKAGSNTKPANLEQARRYQLGTQRGDFTADLLTNLKFEKVDLASDFNLTFKKLMLGRIDLMPISEKYYDKLKREGAEVESVLVLATHTYSIACNLGVADADIANMQAQLNTLLTDGTQEAIFHKYGLDQPTN
nr:transporter substrate-binding domain-containing protein [Rhizobium setariae]